MSGARWDERIARARELAETYDFVAEALTFYAEVAGFQKRIYQHMKGQAGGLPHVLLPWVLPFLSLVGSLGTAELKRAASALREEGEPRWASLLAEHRQAQGTDRFFARALLQPYAEFGAARSNAQPNQARHAVCPACGSKPQLGVLRPEGYGAKRSLICSLCMTEWDYLRIVCPACGVNVFDDLPVYTANEFEHVRVESCDHCKTYIKTVDLSKNGLAVPIVDELATIPLDLWAQEKGYVKLEPNLLGF